MKQKQNLNKSVLLKKSLITSKEARSVGVSGAILDYQLKQKNLNRVARGVYLNLHHKPKVSFEWEDLVYTVLSLSNGVITGISALALYGLTEEVTRFHWIAIPNATSKAKRPNVKFIRVRNINLGKTTMRIGDFEVPIFDVERTLVEAFRLTSIETAIKALKSSFSSHSKYKPDPKKIQKYAQKLHINITEYLIMVTT